jgi:adenylosuccinate synthase
VKTQAVIGLGFGDEGKGLTVDYLCSLSPDALVIRFNGGHQAGHTVVKDGVRHVFSNFGSGTLRGCPTYWSKHCTVEPIGLMNELEDLISKGINPVLYIDAECPITTPYDIKQNRKIERNNEHGSCGVGFGATIEREENFYSLRFVDLYYYQIFRRKLDLISRYYNYNRDDDLFVETIQQLIKNKHIRMVFKRPSADQYIYEGAQGLMLDQHYGFFPHVTRSNCGGKNIPDNNIEFFLVTRAYQTRHGNGPMTTEYLPHTIIDDSNETNCEHLYQGQFRKGILDVDLLEYAWYRDKTIRESATLNLVVTCMDHLAEYKFVRNGKVIKCSTKQEFLHDIASSIGISTIYFNDSNESKTMKKI